MDTEKWACNFAFELSMRVITPPEDGLRLITARRSLSLIIIFHYAILLFFLKNKAAVTSLYTGRLRLDMLA